MGCTKRTSAVSILFIRTNTTSFNLHNHFMRAKGWDYWPHHSGEKTEAHSSAMTLARPHTLQVWFLTILLKYVGELGSI